MFQLSSEYSPRGDQPQAIATLTGLVREGRRHIGAPRRDGLGQDLLDRQRGGEHRPADPGHLAEQDAGRPALQRVPGLLPVQRGRVLRLVLRLLPARGVHPAVGHLHREGRADQRRDRPDAPLGDQVAAGAARRPRRRLGLVHLRHRRARHLSAAPPRARRGRADRPGRDHPAPGRRPVRAQRLRLPPRDLPRSRRRGRGLPGERGVDRAADRALRRRDRRAVPDRPAAGRGARAHRPGAHLPGEPLRHRGGAARARVLDHPGRARRAAGLPAPEEPLCSRRSGSSSGPSSTWRCCASSASATASRTTRAT